MMRVFFLVAVAQAAAPVNLKLRGGDVAAAPVPAGAPGPAPCRPGPCCEEQELRAELEALKSESNTGHPEKDGYNPAAHDGDGNGAAGGIGTKEWLEKHDEMEKKERACMEETSAINTKKANEAQEKAWTDTKYQKPGPHVLGAPRSPNGTATSPLN